MAGGKLSPRQKMIGMMYLVLTALLALNISKDIIEAFVMINTGIEKTTDAFRKKNDVTYSAFDKAKSLDPAKVTKFWDKAMAARKLSADLFKYIEDLKRELMVKTDKLEKPVSDTIHLPWIEGKDNNDVPAQILFGESEDGSKGKSRELKNKIAEYKKNVAALLKDVKGGDKVDLGLDISDPPASIEHGKQNWEVFNFAHMRLAPIIVIMSKLQADIKNTEGDVINHLLTQISAEDFKFDTLAAKVISKSNYVLLGSEYDADIFVAAFSTTQNPMVWLGDVDTLTGKIKGAIDSTTVKVERGVGRYIEKPTAEGEKEYSGIVRVKSPTGIIKEYPFQSSYIAAKPNLVVSADKMNVLYIGVDNPMSISVPGVPSEKVEASLSGGGSLSRKGKGAFIARVSSPGKVNINVRAEINGVKQSMGRPVEFRVKRVPDPVARVGGKSSGPMSKAVLNAQGGVIPVLENFDFDLNFIVFEFEMVIAGKGRDIMTSKAKSNAISGEMKELIGRTRLGDKVYFENIKAKGPDGTTRNLNAISFTIQ